MLAELASMQDDHRQDIFLCDIHTNRQTDVDQSVPPYPWCIRRTAGWLDEGRFLKSLIASGDLNKGFWLRKLGFEVIAYIFSEMFTNFAS